MRLQASLLLSLILDSFKLEVIFYLLSKCLVDLLCCTQKTRKKPLLFKQLFPCCSFQTHTAQADRRGSRVAQHQAWLLETPPSKSTGGTRRKKDHSPSPKEPIHSLELLTWWELIEAIQQTLQTTLTRVLIIVGLLPITGTAPSVILSLLIPSSSFPCVLKTPSYSHVNTCTLLLQLPLLPFAKCTIL